PRPRRRRGQHRPGRHARHRRRDARPARRGRHRGPLALHPPAPGADRADHPRHAEPARRHPLPPHRPRDREAGAVRGRHRGRDRGGEGDRHGARARRLPRAARSARRARAARHRGRRADRHRLGRAQREAPGLPARLRRRSGAPRLGDREGRAQHAAGGGVPRGAEGREAARPPARLSARRSSSRSLGPPPPWRRIAAVGEVYADFERELHRLGGKYAAHPRRETIRLPLLALEREQLVATGYREDVIAECLAAMPIGDAARDVIRHALLWVWKDEEMDTIYVRGALLKLGSLRSDEERHKRLFALFAAALDEHDRLRPGMTASTLAAEVAAVGEPFLPRALRTRAAAESPLGSGGPVWVVCGERAEDKLLLFHRLLDAAGLRRRLEECARAGGKPIGELRIAIKPSFMLGYHRKDRSCLTDPALVRELARYLRAAGAGDVAVVESPNIYDQFYRHRSVPEVARYFDIPAPEFRPVDLGDDQVPHAYGRGMAQYSVGRTWRDADFRISFAKLRSHPVEHVHLSIANTEGLGMRCDHFLFAERQAQRESAVMTLLGDFPPHFALIEGYDLAPDGILGAMGSPRPKAPRRLYAGADALAVDVVAARHLGLRDPRQSSMLRAAFHWFGGPSAAAHVIGPD